MNYKLILSVIIGGLLMMIFAALNHTPAVATNSPESETAAVIEKAPPEPVPEPLICNDCHRSPNINTNEGVAASKAFCLDCHREADTHRMAEQQKVGLRVTEKGFNENQPRHQYIACIHCHTDVARSPHKTETGSQCLECHVRHSEGPANEPHLRVDCQACHFKSEFVRLDPKDHRVKLAHADYEGLPVSLSDHAMADVSDEETCKKCHFRKNPVGAPAAVLPSKSVICILCHTSPLAAGSPIFGLAGILFLGGMMIMIGFWYRGSVKGEEDSLHRKISLSSESVWTTIFSKQIFSLVKIFILDIVLQRRILKESVSRWSMHSLIFTAILLRFFLSLFTAVGFYLNPDGNWMTTLMDKNHGFTAFTYDLLGLFILLGIVWAVIRRFVVKPDHVVSEYQDTATLLILGVLTGFGFFLEGARILVTGIPGDMASHSFVGNIVAGICSIFPFDWASVYPVLWWIHGLAAAVLIAYIPFGKMRHIINTPLTYFIEAVDGVKNEKRV
ncbi:respiratory nitrate reductase subunit gamma [Desulfospira joergensenii]|uniref:respiratory nitrate reductase subunit gamma n=1 Tax=Desulfospira joergensenii TaxID=53329 RepID=UPI0003B7010B|nr:respiratory nitrate reductase subunit gamma [Desulfospira joergensenii]